VFGLNLFTKKTKIGQFLPGKPIIIKYYEGMCKLP